MPCGPQFGHYHRYGAGGVCPRCGAFQERGPWLGWRAVEWPAEGYCYGPIRPSPEQRYEPQPLSDDVIQDRVYNTLQADPRIPPDTAVAVEVQDRVVTLTGTVPDKWIKYLIGGDALAVPGVADVDNRIQIQKPGRTPASTQ